MKYNIMAAGLALIFTGCFAQTGHNDFDAMLSDLLNHSVREISVEQALLMNDALFLDARQAEEYEVSHIRNAMWVGYDKFNKSKLDQVPNDRVIIVYCSVGYRSEKVGEKLQDMGYRDVYNLYGGIFDWVNKGQPVVDPKGRETNRVHPYNEQWGKWLRKGQKATE